MAREREDDAEQVGQLLRSADEPRRDPDGDILDLVKHGKRDQALDLLMQRYGKAVYRYCRVELRNEARADDVNQKVFTAAYEDLPQFAGLSSVKTWLFTIARHRMLDDAKAHHRREKRLVIDDSADAEDASLSPDLRIDEARLSEALTHCVEALPSDAREAVLLHYVVGFTFEEMSAICDEKPGTLQARVARAKVRLRACIEKRTGGSQ